MTAVETMDFNTVEQLVDRVGLARVVTMLAVIAAEKADHIRSNWQDDKMARDYVRASAVLGKCEKALVMRCGPTMAR